MCVSVIGLDQKLTWSNLAGIGDMPLSLLLQADHVVLAERISLSLARLVERVGCVGFGARADRPSFWGRQGLGEGREPPLAIQSLIPNAASSCRLLL